MTSIDGIRSIINEQLQHVRPTTTKPASEGTKAPGKLDFSEMLGNAIKEVDNLQKDANQKIEGVTIGGEGVNTHTAMIALEKADVAFQLMSAVRTKIIRAYEEVMRTPV